MALHLCKPKHRSLSKPSLIHLYSTSQNDNNDNDSSQSPLSSYFNDVKASLKQQQNHQTAPSSRGPSKVTSIEEIRKNLSEFQRRSTVPPSMEPNTTASQESENHVSFQALYKRNTNNEASKGKASFETIRESLRQMNSKNSNNSNRSNVRTSLESLSLSKFKESLRLKPEVGNTNTVLGGTQELPMKVFGREMKVGEKSGERDAMRTEFVKMYSYGELGDKLRKLRPGGLEGGFSLGELNERLMRLREMEEKENESRIGGVSYRDLRDSLVKLKISDDEKSRKSAMSAQRLNILGQLGATPNYMQHPPKEHLIEKYFHPDNMSSAEKMKIELSKVREEFKMSESDCGSARVQIAQLTTKIKHLSSALHKKDKHSLKGLQAMVQKRKRLLKYLRRTDWDSYCFVLSKLGLRDNPDYKIKAKTGKSKAKEEEKKRKKRVLKS